MEWRANRTRDRSHGIRAFNQLGHHGPKQHLNHSNFLLYADDLLIFSKIESPSDHILLQEDLNSFVKWSNSNYLKINSAKTFHLPIFKSKPISTFTYNIDSTTITTVSKLNILGVMFDSKLTFKHHIINIAAKCLKINGVIFKILRDFNSKDTPISLFKSLILPHLNYCNLIWSPKQVYLLNTLEKIYKKFIRFYIFKFNLQHIYNLPYHERLNKLNLPSFKSILSSSQLSFISKLTSNKINSPHLLASLKFHTPQYNLRNSPSFYIPLNKHFKPSPLCQAMISFNKFNK